MNQNYALIGDVHSQHNLVKQALDLCQARGLRPIFLGDLFDSHDPECGDALTTFSLVQWAQENLRAIVLHSNHQDKLFRYLLGNNVRMSDPFQRTVNSLLSSLTKEELKDWLTDMPYGVVFRDSRGKEYRCAHAFFSEKARIPRPVNDLSQVFDIPKELRSTFIYGPVSRVDGEPRRVEWWNDSQTSYRRVAGHYHVIHESESSLVLDGQCGGSELYPCPPENWRLPLYNVEERSLTLFSL